MAVRLLKADWRELHRLADRLEPRVFRAFVNALEAAGVPASVVEQAIRSNNPGLAVAALTDLPESLLRDIRSAVEALAVGGMEIAALDLKFNAVNIKAVTWANTYSSQLVTGITNETRQAIRTVISDAILSGQPPAQSAKIIQGLVGLTERDSRAAYRRYLSLLESGDWRWAEQQTAKYAQKLLRARARLIAQTETITSSNMGQQLLWEEAPELAGMRREWIATDDENTCERCAALDGATVSMTGEFTEPAGTAPKSGPVTTLTPSLHPGCRCALGLVES